MSHSSSRPRGAGRKPGGPNGEVRDKPIQFALAPTEEQRIHALLERRGLPLSNAGVRDLLLSIAGAEEVSAA